MPRKRKDPDEAPIDGDRAFDRVINKKKGYTYKWLSDDDIPRFKAMGYTREERGDDAARPVFDMGGEGDAGYRVGSLTLYAAPDALAQRFDGYAQSEADKRMSTVRREAKRSGGYFKSEVLR
jgi:hypothetical protein